MNQDNYLKSIQQDNYLKPLNQSTKTFEDKTFEDTKVDHIARNKAAALVILTRLSASLQMSTASMVERTTTITRTEEL